MVARSLAALADAAHPAQQWPEYFDRYACLRPEPPQAPDESAYIYGGRCLRRALALGHAIGIDDAGIVCAISYAKTPRPTPKDADRTTEQQYHQMREHIHRAVLMLRQTQDTRAQVTAQAAQAPTPAAQASETPNPPGPPSDGARVPRPMPPPPMPPAPSYAQTAPPAGIAW